MNNKVIIIGAGGHGKVIADIVKLNGDIVYGFLDDHRTEPVLGFPVIGRTDNINDFINEDFFFFIAIGDNKTRQKIFQLYHNIKWYTAIHPKAVIAEDVKVGVCTAVMANAVINSGSSIGNGVIINTAESVDHDNVIGDFSHVSPGAHLAGNVSIGERCWIGIGASVINNIYIVTDSIVAAGAVVIKDINEAGIYVGVPAKRKL